MIELNGKRGLVIGIANLHSIAWGCAQSFREVGAELAITYLNERAEPYVRPLAEQVGAPLILPLDIADQNQLEALFDRVEKTWGTLDFILHSIAFAPRDDLHGRVTDCSSQGFLQAMDISCHSLMRIARLAEPLMKKGGSILTVTFEGSERVVSQYHMMGPVKAALESSVRYLAAELGESGVRVNALSPGPISTRAASGIDNFDGLLSGYLDKSPLHRPLTLQDIGNFATFLVSDAARNVSGGIHFIDGGYQVVA